MAAAIPIIMAPGIQGMIIRFALSQAISFLAQKLFAPDVPAGGGAGETAPDQGVKQRIATDTSNKLPVLYGENKVYGSITYADITDDNQTMAFIIALCEGPIESIGTIYWDNYALTLDGNGVVTNAVDANGASDEFLNGNLTIKKFKAGGRCTDMEAFSTKWNTNAANRTMPNVAYLYAELNYNRDDGVTGLSNKLGAVVEGKLIKTLTSNTLSGGTTYSNNPAECLVDYLTNTTYGCGDIITEADLDLETFQTHKDFCDVLVSYTDNNAATVTGKRFTSNGNINTNDTRDLCISDLAINSGGIFSYQLGKFQIISDTIGSSVMSFDADNMYGDVSIINDGFNSALNKLNVSFQSKLESYQDDQVFLELASGQKSYNEPELVQDTKFKFINNNIMAERLANIIVKKSRDSLIVSFKTDTRALTLQVSDIITVTNTTYGFTNKLFRINSISETEMNSDGVSGYTITANEYNADAYTEEALTEFQVSPNTNLPNPRSFGAITDLTSILNDVSSSTPFVKLQWTVPTGLVETFEVYIGNDINDVISIRDFTSSFRTSVGPFTGGDVITHKIFDIEFTDTLVFWVRPINQFSRGSFSNAYNFGAFQPTSGGIVSNESGIIEDVNDLTNPYGTTKRYTQIRYGDDQYGLNMRDSYTAEPAVQSVAYTGTTINNITRTGNADGTGSVEFPIGFDSGVPTNEVQSLSFTGTRVNVAQKELLHINLSDDITNNTIRKTVTGVKGFDANGFIKTDYTSNIAKINDETDLLSLITLTGTNFGIYASIGSNTAYVSSSTNLYSYTLSGNVWSYNTTIADADPQIIAGSNVLTYNSGASTGEVYNSSLTSVESITGLDVVNDIIHSNGNTIAWYNGSTVKSYNITTSTLTTNETLAGVISIKVIDDSTALITTTTKVREINLTNTTGTDKVTGLAIRSDKDNLVLIDTDSFVVSLTATSAYYKIVTGTYTLQETYNYTGDLFGYVNDLFIGSNLVTYQVTPPTSNKRWISGSNTQFSVNLGSLGSLNNVVMPASNDAIDSLEFIRTQILGMSISGLTVSLPKFVSDINPSGGLDYSGYGIIVNTGTATNEATSFVFSDVGSDGINITSNYEYETDGIGSTSATTITLTEPGSVGTITYSLSTDSISDNNTDQIGNDLAALVTSNTENGNEYTATYNTATQTLTLNASTFFISNTDKWIGSVSNGALAGNAAEGDIAFNTATFTTNGALNENYTITASGLNTKTVNGLPLFNLVTFTGGTNTLFTTSLTGPQAAIEFRDALNASLSGYITAVIDGGNDHLVTWTTSIQDDINLDITFSNTSYTVTKSITQGILGTTQTAINNANNTRVELFEPLNSTAVIDKEYLGFVPTLVGSSDTIASIITEMDNTLANWTVEKDLPGANTIRFTLDSNSYYSSLFTILITNNTGGTDTLGDFSTGTGAATITTYGGDIPTYYGLRAVTLANKDAFSDVVGNHSWFQATKNSLNTILPSYRVTSSRTPTFKFDGESGGVAIIESGWNIIPANGSNQYVIDSELLTTQELLNIPIDNVETILVGSEMLYYSGTLYIALRVNTDAEITALSLGAGDVGATIFTNPSTTFTITDSLAAVLIANTIYKWDGTQWIKQ